MKYGLWCVGLALVCLTGCKTPVAEKPEPAYDARASVVAQPERLSAQATQRAFRVLVSAKKGDDGARFHVEGVQQALCDGGFEVVSSGPAELTVGCDLKFAQGAMRGDHVACRGSLALTVKRAEGWNSVTGRALNEIVGVRRFEARGAESRSAEEAVQSFADKLQEKFAPWLRKTCLKVTSDLGLCDVSIVGTGEKAALPAGYPTRLAKTVLGLPGVYGCSMSSAPAGGAAVRVSVLYDKRQFPDGLLNRLRSIEVLKLAP